MSVMDMTHGDFPILTTRKMHIAGIAGELAAFLRGATTLKEFKDFGCNYWDANAAAWHANKGVPVEAQRVGHIYGAQWRYFGASGVNQIAMLQEGLVNNPFGRRHLLTTYDPSTLDDGCLPPCHLLTQFNVTNEQKLDAIVYMRSVDLCLGLPTDVALYAMLLILTAQSTGYTPGRLAFMMGDTHVYHAHSDMLQVQVLRDIGIPCQWKLDENSSLDDFKPEHFELVGYNPQPAIKYELLA
jgi:thymidylate synthase